MQYAFEPTPSKNGNKNTGDFVFGVALAQEDDYPTLMDEMDRLLGDIDQVMRAEELERQAYDSADEYFLAKYRAKHGITESHQNEHNQGIELELD